MPRTASCLAALPVLAVLAASSAAQQDLVWFKFDSPGSATALNFGSAGARAAAPKYGSVHGYAPGWFGAGALKAATFGVQGNSVDTGLTEAISGDLTIAVALKNRYANIPELRSGFVGRNGFSLGTGDTAGPGLQLRGWGGPPLTVDFGVPLCAMTGWNHFAIVIDAGQRQARWFWNGKLVKNEPIPNGVALGKANDPYLIGRDDREVCGSRYDIDELRMTGRAVPDAEIGQWATRHHAGVASYEGSKTSTSPDRLDPAGGVPSLGNPSYGVVVHGRPQTVAVLVLGVSRVRHGTLPLPLDLGTSLWHVSLDVLAPVLTDEHGVARQPMPIPELASLDQVTLHTQAALMVASGLAVTNALAHAIGH